MLTARGRIVARVALILAFLCAFYVGAFTDWSLA
jgi:hypothetical protein